MSDFVVVLVSALSGLYTSAWGAYKDGPWEGFRARTFPRSIWCSFGLATALASGIGGIGGGFRALPLFVVFLLVMGVERIVTEIYKACFRSAEQGRLLIPQRLSAFGQPVERGAVRCALGALGLASVLGILSLHAPVEGPGSLLLVGLLTGLFISVGGAYKDAPFEGFSTVKFPRSVIVTGLASVLLWPLVPLPLGFVIFTLGGLERFLVEYYKSFLVHSVPGKFRPDLPRIRDGWSVHREVLRKAATALVVMLAGLYALALAGWR